MDRHDVVPSLASAGHLALDEHELRTWGEQLGRTIVPPLLVAISGDLGTGKTTLAQSICRGYGVVDEVTSPTFTIVHEYAGARSTVYHLDLYRLQSVRELESIGWDEILAERALTIVEWPERASHLLPHGHIAIDLSHVDGDPARRILYAGGAT